ncbi:hypothetical protein M569_12097, partial [Genlisea aurea]
VFWHKAVDAAVIGNFMKSWADVAKGGGFCSKELVWPEYNSRSMFPPSELIKSSTVAGFLKIGKASMNRYVFDAVSISELKLKSGERSSRVAAVSAVIWKCFMAASQEHGNDSSAIIHTVNLRPRAQPPFPNHSFGNFPGLAVSSAVNNHNIEVGSLTTMIRDSFDKIDGDYVKRMVGEDGAKGYFENMKIIWDGISEDDDDFLLFSSWCGFGFYDLDFGFGSPTWVTRCDDGNESKEDKYLNVVWLMDSKYDGGIEAWVILEESYMIIFDKYMNSGEFNYKNPNPI